MKTISLKKLSIAVVVASFVSNFVFATKNSSNIDPKLAQLTSVFTQLIADYDVDKNNMLSVKELAENNTLTKIFDEVDSNQDKEISEGEFNHYKKSLR